MAFEDIQNLYLYQTQSWSMVLKTVADLAALAVQMGDTDINSQKVLGLSYNVNELIKINEQHQNGWSFLPYEKQAVNIIDAGLISNFLIGYKSLAQTLSEAAPAASAGLPVGSYHLVEADLSEVGLNEETVTVWNDHFEALSQDSQQEFGKRLDLWLDQGDKLSFQFYGVAVVLGLFSGNIIPYSIKEVREIYEDTKADYEFDRLITTLIDTMKDEDYWDFVSEMWVIFGQVRFRDKLAFTWGEMLIYSLLIHLFYYRFEILPREAQLPILQGYFYRGIVLGAPVRQKISEALYQTTNAISFTLADKVFYEALSDSLEKITAETVEPGREKRELKLLKEVIERYIKLAGADPENGYKQQQFVKDFYKDKPNAEHYGRWLHEVISLYVHLRNADLIEKNAGSELSISEVVTNDTIKLIAWFGLGENGASDIVKYFSQENMPVKLGGFLYSLSRVADLNKKETVENCVILNSNLHKYKLLTDDKELIEFHEDDGKFYWNDWVAI